MSDTSKLMHEIAERHFEKYGRLTIHDAVKEFIPLINEDDKERFAAAEIGRQFKQISSRAIKAAEDDAERQDVLPFPDLKASYVIDSQDRYLKRTENLIRLELIRVIQIREESVAADHAHLNVLKDVRDKLAPYWDKHPDFTLGQVAALYVQDVGGNSGLFGIA